MMKAMMKQVWIHKPQKRLVACVPCGHRCMCQNVKVLCQRNIGKTVVVFGNPYLIKM